MRGRRRWPLAIGAVLAFAGAAMLGVVAYQAFAPDPAAREAAAAAAFELQDEWSAGPVSTEIADNPMTRPLGKGFAILRVPALGSDWAAVIVEGVQDEDLLGKVGHFKRSAEPGRVGNFALAAHRLTRGSLFRDMDRVRKGDRVIVETRTHWFVYVVTGRKIIRPEDIDVIAPVPFKPGETPVKAVITLTTCHPWYSSTSRLAVFGELAEARLKSMGPPEALSQPASVG